MGWGGDKERSSFEPYVVLRERIGYVPKLFRAQELEPSIVEAEVALLDSILFSASALSQVQKQCILFVDAAARHEPYCFAWHYHGLKLLGVPEPRLDEIAADFERVDLSPVNRALLKFTFMLGRARRNVTEADIEGTLSAGLSEESLVDAVLATALGAFLCRLARELGAAPDFPGRSIPAPALASEPDDTEGGISASDIREILATVQPAQALRPDALRAQTTLTDAVLRPSASQDRNMVREATQLALGAFLRKLQVGLRCAPDRPPQPENKVHLPAFEARPTDEVVCVDVDSAVVQRVQAGEIDAFEEIITRHSRRVYRTVLAILSDPDEARDAMQDTFLKAFQHLGTFQGRSKFSTWLLTIANNTGRQLLRERRPLESLDESAYESDDVFRPRQIQAWAENPEQLYSRIEMRTLVENAVMKLPVKYRIVLMLRDIEQLPTDEAAAALGLAVPALKARLLRGRLMLREALAPGLSRAAKGASLD